MQFAVKFLKLKLELIEKRNLKKIYHIILSQQYAWTMTGLGTQPLFIWNLWSHFSESLLSEKQHRAVRQRRPVKYLSRNLQQIVDKREIAITLLFSILETFLSLNA